MHDVLLSGPSPMKISSLEFFTVAAVADRALSPRHCPRSVAGPCFSFSVPYLSTCLHQHVLSDCIILREVCMFRVWAWLG